jgi:integrase
MSPEVKKETRKRRGGVYSINGRWSYDYYYKGRRIRTATEAVTKAEAQKLRAVLLADIEREEDYHLPTTRGAILLKPFSDDYIENYAKVNKRSWKRDQTCIGHILGFFGNVPVDRITREQCEEFKKERAKAQQERAWREAAASAGTPAANGATANRDMACLKKMFSWGVDLGKLKDNPARAVKRFKEPNKPFHVVSAEEERRLLEAATQAKKAAHLLPIVTLALGTGMRLGEILSLEWAHVDFTSRTITVAKSKSGKSRSIPMVWDGVVEALKGLQSGMSGGKYVFPDRDGKPMGSIKTAFIKARATAGISPKCRFHDLRHTFGSRCAQLGMDVMTIKELMGHASVTTTMRYMHVGEDHKRRALREAAAKWQKNSDATVTKPIEAVGVITVTA